VRCFLLSISLLSFTSLFAQSDRFISANKTYNELDYASAIKQYDEILSNGFESEDLYLNLGNAYLKTENLGKAILCFEKGLKLNCDHKALSQNLKYANKKVQTQITAIPDFFVSRYWQNIVTLFSAGTWAILQILLLFSITIAIGFWLLSKELRKKRIAFYSLFFLVVSFLFAMLAGYQRTALMKNSTHAIIIDNAQMHSSASEQSELLYNLSSGVKVKLLDKIGEYHKVELMDKEVGWIVERYMEAI